ncbi:MAG: SMP-30/gluconolactonase/LRE family protein [Rhizobiaceae bacterium]|nr:SMP-30/gluconolactonase/LRE family protein [Rhizobiaceae bacterium]
MVKTVIKLTGLAIVALAAYLLAWPVPIDPVAWNAPKSAGYTGDFLPNEKLKALEFLELDGREGPEDVAFGSDGLIYAAVIGGVILRIDPASGDVAQFAKTDGRPLGIEFGSDGILYVADAYRGLLAIDEDGTVSVLAEKTDSGSPIKYADDLDITASGIVYFSDASTKFGAQEFSGTLSGSLLDLMEHGPNGRILKYDPATKTTTVVVDGYSFANGVALANDDSYVLFTETGTYAVHKYWLSGDKAGQVETIMENLPGFPDNINNNEDGTFWLGLVSPRSGAIDALSDKPFLRKVVQRLPASLRPGPQRYGFIVRINGEGKVLETLQDPSGGYALTTGAVDGPDGIVVVSSLTEPRLGILPK